MLVYILVNDEGKYPNRQISNIGVFSSLDKAIEALMEILTLNNIEIALSSLIDEYHFTYTDYYIQARELDAIETYDYPVYSLVSITEDNHPSQSKWKSSSPKGFHIICDVDESVRIITPQIAEFNEFWTRKFYSSQYIETR